MTRRCTNEERRNCLDEGRQVEHPLVCGNLVRVPLAVYGVLVRPWSGAACGDGGAERFL